KAGFERGQTMKSRVTAWVLGTNGHEVTALVGNMPGALQLLPNKQYRDNHGQRSWLRFRWNTKRSKSVEQHFATFPKSNPYDEIYKENDPNALAPMITPELLNPE